MVEQPDQFVGEYAIDKQGHTADSVRRLLEVHHLCAVDSFFPQ